MQGGSFLQQIADGLLISGTVEHFTGSRVGDQEEVRQDCIDWEASEKLLHYEFVHPENQKLPPQFVHLFRFCCPDTGQQVILESGNVAFPLNFNFNFFELQFF